VVGAAAAERIVAAAKGCTSHQLHIVRSSRVSAPGGGGALRDISAGRHTVNNPFDLPDELGRVNHPWNPLMVNDPNVRSSWHLPNFIKWVYLDSQVTVGVLTNNNSAAIPGENGPRPPKNVTESEAFEGLTAGQTMAARNFINKISGSRRALGHGQLYMGIGNLDFMHYQIEELKPDTWKGYNIATAAKVDKDPNSDMRRWRLDDEVVAFPTYDLIKNYATEERMEQYPGLRTLCVHKGLSTDAGRVPELGHPMDIPKAATHYPDFNFVIYHACIRPGFWVLNALNDVRSGRLRKRPGRGWPERAPRCSRHPLEHGVCVPLRAVQERVCRDRDDVRVLRDHLPDRLRPPLRPVHEDHGRGSDRLRFGLRALRSPAVADRRALAVRDP
jgi:hypothetical protein